MGGGAGANIIGSGGGEADPEIIIDEDLIKMQEEKNLEEVKSTVDKYLNESGLSDSVETTIEARGLVLSFKDSLFFDSGKAEVRSEEASQLGEIGKILNQAIISDSLIRVEGHTDNIPINNDLYKSNWDLSVIRASNVVQILVNESGIDPQRISAVGYGEYRPKADNNTEQGRASNRRVDILIMNSEFNEVENNSN
jgi:chemotaxis protein MotB